MKNLLTITAAAALTAVLVGCNDNDHVSWKDVTGDLTPEMHGLAERREDNHNAFSMMANQNIRMISDDIDRTLYIDHPSRLTPFPVIYSSGQPR